MTFLTKLANAKKVPLWFFQLKKANASEQEIIEEIKTSVISPDVLTTEFERTSFSEIIFAYYNAVYKASEPKTS